MKNAYVIKRWIKEWKIEKELEKIKNKPSRLKMPNGAAQVLRKYGVILLEEGKNEGGNIWKTGPYYSRVVEK